MSMTREQKAQIAEAIRVKAQRELLPFVLWTKPDYMAGWFQKVVCETLDAFVEDVLAKRSPRLMLFAPPSRPVGRASAATRVAVNRLCESAGILLVYAE